MSDTGGDTDTDTDKKQLIHCLGWTQQEADDIRMQLISFEELWDAPGMEEYDKL